ncbi:Calcium channel [Colletotrichum sp. SAR 10_86]|nr:Calcium channel [Colletotrichum sp. SAR 10_65]KAI8230114.1 Calcium channel [Colletotrichum sp. SAR 10_86]KAJ5008165.1 Calcium channel [Colletotrichum sp. SAR 10_66]
MSQKPRLLCLHGGGTSAQIFQIQLIRLQRILDARFDFLYIDAPMDSAPGPGVLPVFEGCGPYRRWVSDDPATPADEFQAQKDTAVSFLKTYIKENGPFAGFVGFSQGCRAISSLLLEHQRGDDDFLGPDAKPFALFICGTFPPFVTHEEKITAPTVHVVGLEDPYESASEQLYEQCSEKSTRRILRFPGGHHLPTAPETIQHVANMTLSVYKETLRNWFSRLMGWDKHPRHHHDFHADWIRDDRRRLLPQYRNENIQSAIPAAEVTKVALKLRHLIELAVPCELDEEEITKAHSKIITTKVIKAAKEAGGSHYRSCVVFCLVVCKRWFKHQALVELWDADMHRVRAVACEVVAKQIIETEDDFEYLMHSVLLRRYSIIVDGEATPPANVVEKAVDLHAVRVIGSSGYQKCISYLWKGWLVQDEDDPAVFIDYKDKDNTSFFVHMDPDRIRAPMYQNATQVIISFVYIGLYTAVINSVNPTGVFDTAEVLLYIFTLGFICEEVTKFWKAGYHILGFWNAFNSVLYSFITLSFILRIIGLTHQQGDDTREFYSKMSYNFLAFSAPMIWSRLLLYLDSFRFFGAMLVVLKVMMKESIIFFALLIVLVIGFLQAFIGLDFADDWVADDILFILQAMANAVMQSPDFDGFDKFSPPFGIILYYCFTFIIMVVLLNILIALYNSAYEDIYGNANDEYLALFAQKTMQFVRAPDENVYIPPFNLLEMLVICLFWWMEKSKFERMSDIIMGIIYSPVLVIAAWHETKTAGEIRSNRARGEEDDDTIEEWEQMMDQVDFEADGWNKLCISAKTNLEADPTITEVQKLRGEVEELKKLLVDMTKALSSGGEVEPSQASTLIDVAEPEQSESKTKKKKKGKKSKKDKKAGGEGNASASSSSSDEE